MTTDVVFPTSPSLLDQEAFRGLVRASNALADATYREAYSALAADPAKLAELDVFSVEIDGAPLPMLRNGSNLYYDRSSRPARLDPEHLAAQGYQSDVFVVIPEVASILAAVKAAGWPAHTAIRSIAGAAPPGADETLMFPGLGIAELPDSRDFVRAYDSHLSPWLYGLIVGQLLARLNIDAPLQGVNTLTSPYLPDLARHFSTTPSDTLLFSEQHLVREENAADANRGLQRWYQNADAPVDARLLLIGDSHSYSALAQMLSFFFKDVDFVWASRRLGFAGDKAALAKLANDADVVVEESAERFFLKNYTLPLA